MSGDVQYCSASLLCCVSKNICVLGSKSANTEAERLLRCIAVNIRRTEKDRKEGRGKEIEIHCCESLVFRKE